MQESAKPRKRTLAEHETAAWFAIAVHLRYWSSRFYYGTVEEWIVGSDRFFRASNPDGSSLTVKMIGATNDWWPVATVERSSTGIWASEIQYPERTEGSKCWGTIARMRSVSYTPEFDQGWYLQGYEPKERKSGK